MDTMEYERILRRMEKTQPMPEALYLHDKAVDHYEIDKAKSIVARWAQEHPERSADNVGDKLPSIACTTYADYLGTFRDFQFYVETDKQNGCVGTITAKRNDGCAIVGEPRHFGLIIDSILSITNGW